MYQINLFESSKEKLFKAIKNEKIKEVQELFSRSPIELRLFVNCISFDHKTPLFYAINSKSLPMVRLLTKHGADLNKMSSVYYGIDCSSHRFESAQEPPLVTAVRLGSSEIIEFLLRNGSNVNLQSVYSSKGHFDVLFIESENENPMKTVDDGALHFGKPRLSKSLSLREERKEDFTKNNKGPSSLHHACDSCQIEIVKLLLSNKADPNAEEGRRLERPLHVVSRCQENLCENQCHVMELLCSSGADIQTVNKKRFSPLYFSCIYGCEKKVEILLKHGASPNNNKSSKHKKFVCDWGGYGSPLHVAAYKNFTPLAMLLIRAGANINFRNQVGLTPLQLNLSVAKKSNIAALLIFHGALINQKINKQDKLEEGRSEQSTILSKIISRPRLDCESLAILLIEAGYNLNQDPWLGFYSEKTDKFTDETFSAIQNMIMRMRNDSSSLEEKRLLKLCSWLHTRQLRVAKLIELSKFKIRLQLSLCGKGKSIVINVKNLPIPNSLKNFILLKNNSGQDLEPSILEYLEELQK